ncbi:MAG: hypothetical protein WDN24_20145 [Sphingomonas sp.]
MGEEDRGGPLHDLLAKRAKTGTGVDARLGARERARSTAQDAAKAWGARFADWSAPTDTITRILAGYADQITKLNIDINGEVAPDAAILSFWLEVAPKAPPDLRRRLVRGRQDRRSTRSRPALVQAGFNDLAAGLDPATARNAGGVSLIAPAGCPPSAPRS